MRIKALYTVLCLLMALGCRARAAESDADAPGTAATEPDADAPGTAVYSEGLTLEARAGYSIGATTPIGIPATIRKLNSFHLTPNFLIGIDARMQMFGRWGIQAGLHLENKGMDAAVTTKGYHMAMVKDGEELEGVYTGRVEQHVKQWMLTVPLQVCYVLDGGGRRVKAAAAPQHSEQGRNRWCLRAGPYISLLTARDFSGNVSDGYLRKDTPTGQKIEIGHEEDERATYDFSGDMRRWQAGIAIGADWRMASRLGISADLSWGLTGIMRSDFKTVEQTLYPIYGTISITYKLN